MFLRKAALRPVPAYAVVDDNSIDAVETLLDDDADTLQYVLDTAYRDMDRRQPALSTFLAEQITVGTEEIAQSLGYFLAVTVFLAFKEAFPTRLGEVDEEAIRLVLAMLDTDEEMRRSDPTEVFESDDIVAMGQPAVLRYVHHHLEEALGQAHGDVDLKSFDRVYRAVLVEVISLSHAVRAPTGVPDSSSVMA